MADTDIQALIETFEPGCDDVKPFSSAIKKKWGIREEDHAALFISFLHQLTKNDARLLLKMKWDSLGGAQKLNKLIGVIISKNSEFGSSVPKILTIIEQLNKTVENVLSQICNLTPEERKKKKSLIEHIYQDAPDIMDKTHSVKKRVQKLLVTIGGIESITRTIKDANTNLRNIVETANNAIKELTDLDSSGYYELADLVTEKSYIDEKLKALAEAYKEEIGILQANAMTIANKVRELARKYAVSLDSMSNNQAKSFKTQLLLTFLVFLDKRKALKSQSHAFSEILTEEPTLPVLLKHAYDISKPGHFDHHDATACEYEKYVMIPKQITLPRSVEKYEKEMEKKWYQCKDGLFFLNGRIESLFDDTPANIINEIVKDAKDKGQELLYAYLSTDYKVVYTCKLFLSGGKTYELSFTHYAFEKYDYKRVLRSKKILADAIWKESTYVSYIKDLLKDTSGLYGMSLSRCYLSKLEEEVMKRAAKMLCDDFLPALAHDYFKKAIEDICMVEKMLSNNKFKVNDIKTQLINILVPSNTADQESSSGISSTIQLLRSLTVNSLERILNMKDFKPSDEAKWKEELTYTASQHITKVLESYPSCKTIGLTGTIIRRLKETFEATDLKSMGRKYLDEFKFILNEFLMKRLSEYDGTKPISDLMIIDDILYEMDPSPIISEEFGKQPKTNLALSEEQYAKFDEEWLRNELRKAMTTHPEKILEQYDFSLPLDDWCKAKAKNMLHQIKDVQIITTLTRDDRQVAHNLFYDRESPVREAIEKAITQNWGTGNTVAGDHTGIVMVFEQFLRCKRYDALYSLIRRIVDRETTYVPLPLLMYTKQYKNTDEWAEDGADIVNLIEEMAVTYLKQKKKYSSNCQKLQQRLVDDDDTARIKYLKDILDDIDLNGIITEIRAVNIIKNKKKNSYILPHDLDADSLKRLFEEQFIPKGKLDSKAFLLNYDYKEDLDTWCCQRIRIFLGDILRLHSILNGRIEPFYAEYGKQLRYIYNKYIIKEVSYVEGKMGGDKISIESFDDFKQNLNLTLFKNDKKVLFDFRHDSSLITYINSVADNCARKKIRTKIRNDKWQNRMLKKDHEKKKKQEEIAAVEEMAEELKVLLVILRPKRDLFCPNSKEDAFERQLDIVEEVHVNMRKRSEVKEDLRKKYPDLKVDSSFTSWERRGRETVKMLQKILSDTDSSASEFKAFDEEIRESIKKEYRTLKAEQKAQEQQITDIK